VFHLHCTTIFIQETYRSKEFFAAICNRYGQNLCHFIELNSANPANPADECMPDPWKPILRRNCRGLHSGLELAKKNLLSPSKTATKHPSEVILINIIMYRIMI
jgi:hypothetical protein